MGQLTATCPKPMLPLLGKPKLAYSVEKLPDEITEVIIIVGYLGHLIREYFRDSFSGKHIRYVEQVTLDGSGGAVALVQDMVAQRFLVLNGDDLYCQEDLERLLQHDLAVLACEVDDASQYGVLEADARGRLSRIIERPHAVDLKMVNTGAYMLSRNFFKYPPMPISATEYGLPQTLVQMNDRFDIVVETTKRWQPIGQPEDIPKGEAFLKRYYRL